jgi:AcrR family transcriptional regulator
MDKSLNDRGWRGSAELWLDAAYDILVEQGVEAVKVMPLAQRLGMSRTSFYWHFQDREALLSGLVARWHGKNTANLVARTESPALTITQSMMNVFDCWITPSLFDSKLEFAIRTWALNDAGLARTLLETDAVRIAALKAMFLRFDYPEKEADIRARTVYLTQVGYIAMRTEESLALRLERMPAYTLTFTGLAPDDAEIADFQARHLPPQ